MTTWSTVMVQGGIEEGGTIIPGKRGKNSGPLGAAGVRVGVEDARGQDLVEVGGEELVGQRGAPRLSEPKARPPGGASPPALRQPWRAIVRGGSTGAPHAAPAP